MNPIYVYRVVYLSLSHCIIYSCLSKSCSSWHLEHQQYVAQIVVIIGRFWSSFHLVLALVIMWANNVLWAFIVERATKTYNQYWHPTVLAPQNVNKLCISCSFLKTHLPPPFVPSSSSTYSFIVLFSLAKFSFFKLNDL